MSALSVREGFHASRIFQMASRNRELSRAWNEMENCEIVVKVSEILTRVSRTRRNCAKQSSRELGGTITKRADNVYTGGEKIVE